MDSDSVEATGFALCVVAQEIVPWIRENIELAWERQDKIRLHPSNVSPAESNISATVELEDFIRGSTADLKGACYWIKKPITASESSEMPEVMVSFVEPVDFKVIGLPIVPLTCFPQSTCEMRLIPPIKLKPANRIEIEKNKAIRLTGVSKLLIIKDQDEQTEVHLDIDDASRLESLSTILDSKNAASSSVFLSGFGDKNSCLWDSIHLRSVPDSKMVAQIIVDRLPLSDGDSDFLDHASTVLGTRINLQEAMAEVRTNALTSHEQVTDSEEMENDDWILLTATISGPHNVKQAVKDMQAQFPANELWKNVEHHGENGRSSMSLSITEGRTRAAIMLIVLPESQSGRDSEQDVSSFQLHNAANDDDVLLMEWLLNNSSEEHWIEKLQQKNEDGFSVLQQACRVGSMSIVHYLMSLGAVQKDPLLLLQAIAGSGETALHLSVRNGYPQILHELLKSAERADRKELLSLSNNENQTLEDLAEVINEADSLLTKAVIKYHRWISNKEFKSFFERHDYSLFLIPMEEKMMRSMYTKTDSHNPDELGQVRFKNFDTMICLRFCDLHPESEKSKDALKSGCRFNRESLKIDPNSLHAWSNRGSILIRDDHTTDKELEGIAHRVLQLQVERGKQHFLSVIDYAYGFAETNRSDASRQKGCKMFDDAFEQVQGLDDIVYLSSYCDYFHAKILIRRAQDTFSPGQKLEGENLRKVIEGAIDCLIRVAIHNVDEFMGDLWIWLAELQGKSICERIERDKGKEQYVQSLLSKFQREVGKDEDIRVDVASCIQQAKMIAPDLHGEAKFLLRIGKLYLQQARESTCKQEIEKFFKEARDISKTHIFNEKPIFMGVTNYVPAVLGLWAMQYTSKGEGRRGVIIDYEKMTGEAYEQGDEGRLWRHASTEFYGPAEDVDGMLSSTIEPLANIVYKQDGAHIAGEWLARVKALLGHSCKDIEAVFYHSQENSDTGNKTKNYEKLGRYYESIGKPDLALDNYRSAITNEGENKGYYKPRVSKYRLIVLGPA